MSLDTLVEEIRTRGEAELREVVAESEADLQEIASNRDSRVTAIRLEAEKTAETEIARERAQRLAAAHLGARHLLYEAQEQRLEQGITETRQMLADLTEQPEYASVLRRMIASANARLGRSVRISGRAEDAPLLQRLAGKAFDPTPRSILGGIVADTSEGRRRLDLSFDELLRQRADAVRALLA